MGYAKKKTQQTKKMNCIIGLYIRNEGQYAEKKSTTMPDLMNFKF